MQRTRLEDLAMLRKLLSKSDFRPAEDLVLSLTGVRLAFSNPAEDIGANLAERLAPNRTALKRFALQLASESLAECWDPWAEADASPRALLSAFEARLERAEHSPTCIDDIRELNEQAARSLSRARRARNQWPLDARPPRGADLALNLTLGITGTEFPWDPAEEATRAALQLASLCLGERRACELAVTHAVEHWATT